MSQTVVTILGVLGLLVLTLLLGTGFGADMDFSLRRSHPAPSLTEGSAGGERGRATEPATVRCEWP